MCVVCVFFYLNCSCWSYHYFHSEFGELFALPRTLTTEASSFCVGRCGDLFSIFQKIPACEVAFFIRFSLVYQGICKLLHKQCVFCPRKQQQSSHHSRNSSRFIFLCNRACRAAVCCKCESEKVNPQCTGDGDMG